MLKLCPSILKLCPVKRNKKIQRKRYYCKKAHQSMLKLSSMKRNKKMQRRRYY